MFRKSIVAATALFLTIGLTACAGSPPAGVSKAAYANGPCLYDHKAQNDACVAEGRGFRVNSK